MPRPNKTDFSKQDDQALVKFALNHEDFAFTVLIRRFKLPLFKFALRHSGDADDAEDIVQETFVAAHRNLFRYNPKYSCQKHSSNQHPVFFITRCNDVFINNVANFQKNNTSNYKWIIL